MSIAYYGYQVPYYYPQNFLLLPLRVSLLSPCFLFAKQHVGQFVHLCYNNNIPMVKSEYIVYMLCIYMHYATNRLTCMIG